MSCINRCSAAGIVVLAIFAWYSSFANGREPILDDFDDGQLSQRWNANNHLPYDGTPRERVAFDESSVPGRLTAKSASGAPATLLLRDDVRLQESNGFASVDILITSDADDSALGAGLCVATRAGGINNDRGNIIHFTLNSDGRTRVLAFDGGGNEIATIEGHVDDYQVGQTVTLLSKRIASNRYEFFYCLDGPPFRRVGQIALSAANSTNTPPMVPGIFVSSGSGSGTFSAQFDNFKAGQVNVDELFPSFSDSHTVGLWLFDEPQYLNVTLTDASSEMYDLRLLPGGQLTAGRFGNALRVSSHAGPAAREAWQAREYDNTKFVVHDARPVAPPGRLLATLDQKVWTCEYWLKLDGPPQNETVVLEFGTGDAQHFQCTLAPVGKTFFLRGSAVDKGFACPTDASRLTDGQWHHVAFTYAAGQVQHFLDGRAQTAPVSGVAPLAPRAVRRIISRDDAKPIPIADVASAEQPGLIGVIYANPQEFKDPLNIRVCGSVDFYRGVTNDIEYSERWRGQIRTSPVEKEDPYKGAYANRPTMQEELIEFFAECKDGVRLTIGGHAVIDGLNDPAARRGKCRLAPDKSHPLVLEFSVRAHPQPLHGRLLWRRPGRDWELVPGAALSHSTKDQTAALNEANGLLSDRFYLTLGAGRFYESPLDGQLDELRFSDVARYAANFPLPSSLSRNYGPASPKPTSPSGPPLLFTGEHQPGPIKLGSRKHVFVDDVLAEARQGIHVVSHPPVLRSEDVKGVQSIPDSVYELNGRKIRFICHSGGPPPRPGSTNFDGRMFEDPDPNVRLEERFKYAGRDVQRGIYVFASPDGIHWRRNETIMLPFDPDGGNEIFWDDQRGMYVTFLRHMGWNHGRAPFGRAAAIGQTREFYKPWPFAPQPNPDLATKAFTLPHISAELPTPFEPYPQEAHGGFVTNGHVYRTRAVKYPWAPDTYYAFVWRLFYPPEGGDQIRATELATSRDGQHWRFFGKPWYYAIGWELEPGFKVTEALSEEGLVRHGDELWTYAWLREDTHNFLSGKSRFVRYVNRLDGLTSLSARQKVGWLRTRPLVFTGDRLELNVAVQGSMRVGLLDEAGNEIPEFTVQDCELIKEDAIRHTVEWRNEPDVSRLAGRVVRLQIEMQDARLYALQFIQSQEPVAHHRVDEREIGN